ncbi:methylated-DNA--[protein]-cysteine S-methyltransferase [Luteithermobacter gelatinilyticus]|uniref:methylated-DNA--[protein]-cysteine S-methyltransferase n=1 Tax=Luteithermobacter gelatinilyticus TaxID=2582913 RepID=UPI001105A411|nr:methylated-DNA--[protein]-cysteine S-methyltransferase [Luteithermobacter gelatinilyticus]
MTSCTADFTLDTIDSPVGRLFAVSRGSRLCALDFEDYEARMAKLLQKRYGAIEIRPERNSELRDTLAAYFDGELDRLEKIDVEMEGTTFQKKVWRALRNIPAGTTWTYGELAHYIGHPTAVRAVGMTNGLNPIAIVVPCHRVIGANGKLTGYAGGLARKKALLAHEHAHHTPLTLFQTKS